MSIITYYDQAKPVYQQILLRYPQIAEMTLYAESDISVYNEESMRPLRSSDIVVV